MKCYKPKTDQEAEFTVLCHGVPCVEYILPTAWNQDINILECYVPVNEGDEVTISGRFTGSVLHGVFDLLVDGSFLRDKRIEGPKTGKVKHERFRKLDFETVFDAPRPAGHTSLSNPGLVEGVLHVKTLTVDQQTRLSTASKGNGFGVGSIAIVVSLNQDTLDNYNATIPPSYTCGDWDQRSLSGRKYGGITPTHELIVHVLDNKVSDTRHHKHRRHFVQNKKYGPKPWATFIFYYRSRSAIENAGCILNTTSTRALEPSKAHSLTKALPEPDFTKMSAKQLVETQHTTKGNSSPGLFVSPSPDEAHFSSAPPAHKVPNRRKLMGQVLPREVAGGKLSGANARDTFTEYERAGNQFSMLGPEYHCVAIEQTVPDPEDRADMAAISHTGSVHSCRKSSAPRSASIEQLQGMKRRLTEHNETIAPCVPSAETGERSDPLDIHWRPKHDRETQRNALAIQNIANDIVDNFPDSKQQGDGSSDDTFNLVRERELALDLKRKVFLTYSVNAEEPQMKMGNVDSGAPQDSLAPSYHNPVSMAETEAELTSHPHSALTSFLLSNAEPHITPNSMQPPYTVQQTAASVENLPTNGSFTMPSWILNRPEFQVSLRQIRNCLTPYGATLDKLRSTFFTSPPLNNDESHSQFLEALATIAYKSGDKYYPLDVIAAETPPMNNTKHRSGGADQQDFSSDTKGKQCAHSEFNDVEPSSRAQEGKKLMLCNSITTSSQSRAPIPFDSTIKKRTAAHPDFYESTPNKRRLLELKAENARLRQENEEKKARKLKLRQEIESHKREREEEDERLAAAELAEIARLVKENDEEDREYHDLMREQQGLEVKLSNDAEGENKGLRL